MNEQEILGNHYNLIFYYPVGSHLLYSQIYDINSDEVIAENPVRNELDYDFAIMIYKAIDKKRSPEFSKKISQYLSTQSKNK